MRLPPRLGRYEVLAELGHGEFGVLYRGHDESARRSVLITYFTAISGNPARSSDHVLAMTHRNVARVIAVSEHDGHTFVVNDVAKGASLESLARQRGFDMADALGVIEQTCAGVLYGHQRGTLHLMLHPALIWVSDGIAKVLGFGVQGTSTTPGRFVAPEVSAGLTPDARADVFALGVMLESLTTAADADGLDVDARDELQRVITRATAADRDERFPDVAALASALTLVRLSLTGDVFDSETIVEAAPAWDQIRTPSDVAVARPRSRANSAVYLSGTAVAVASAALAYALWTPTTGREPGPVLAVTTDPAGVRVIFDGQPTEYLTPAVVKLPTPLPRRIELVLDGYERSEIALDAGTLATGRVSVPMRRIPPPPPPPPPPGGEEPPTGGVDRANTVRIVGEYAFSVHDSNGIRSTAAARHDITATPGETLWLRSDRLYLNWQVRVGRQTIVAPGTATLTVRANDYERCRVRINGILGDNPPIARVAVAAGRQEIDLVCPGGRVPRREVVTIAAGETATVKFAATARPPTPLR